MFGEKKLFFFFFLSMIENDFGFKFDKQINNMKIDNIVC